MGGSQPQGSALAVLEVKHDPLACGVARPAATALPELRRMQLGQQGFQRPGRVHLLTHNL